MKVTVKELQKKTGLDYVTAASVLKLAVLTGQGTEAGKIKTSLTGKGKPSTVYEVPDTLTFDLTKKVEIAEAA